MNTAELGKYAERFVAFRQMMAAVPPTSRLAVFENAVAEVAKYIGNELDRVVAADELADMAVLGGLDDTDAVQWIISRGFEKIKKNGNGHAAYTDYGADPKPPPPTLGEWNAGDDPGNIEPRQWLLGVEFCREYISSIVAAGGVGKSALRLLQFVSMAIGRSLCKQFVFRRSRVLLISLEDNTKELNRRIKALLLHYGIDRSELDGWLYCAAPKQLKLAVMQNRARVRGGLEVCLRETIQRIKPDLVSLDPFVKTHSLEENDSGDMDFVCDMLAQMGTEFNIAIDSPHHVHKGTVEPGNADAGRGSSGIRDAARIVSTLCAMTEEEADQFNIKKEERRFYVRLDPAKTNIAAPPQRATWFRLIGVPIGNKTAEYPNGDTVQVAEPWEPETPFGKTSSNVLNQILDVIAGGIDGGKRRYSNAPRATDRAVWPIVQEFCPEKSEGQCRAIIHAWLTSKLIYAKEYTNDERREKEKGLYVDNEKRPERTPDWVVS